MEYIKQPLNKQFEAHIYKTPNSSNFISDWEQVTGNANLFMQVPYMKALEKSKLEAMDYRYVLIYKQKQVVAAVYFQVLALSLNHFEKLMKFNNSDGDERHCVNELVLCVLKQRTSKRPFYMLICGNLLESGENAFAYTSEISNNEAAKLLYSTIRQMVKVTKHEFKTAAILVKDFYRTTRQFDETLCSNKFHAIQVEPNMLMPLEPGWHTFNDYLDALSTKYRTRAKRIFKKGELLERRLFTASDIKANTAAITDFYNAIHTKDKFNLTTIDTAYFISMKETFGDKFIFEGYYITGKLIGFRSAFICGVTMEAHYIGFDMADNKQYEVYQNMLYDFVKTGIEARVSRIAFGRTASEIKTNIGAVAHELTCYIKHTNRLINTFLSSVTKTIKPTDFVARNPFKKINEDIPSFATE